VSSTRHPDQEAIRPITSITTIQGITTYDVHVIASYSGYSHLHEVYARLLTWARQVATLEPVRTMKHVACNRSRKATTRSAKKSRSLSSVLRETLPPHRPGRVPRLQR
jgi:hypothetical protein